MSTITVVGIDLAKNVFAVHGVDETGKASLVKPRVMRGQLTALIAQLPPCLIGMEACSGAHYWARTFQRYGHTVKLMSPKLVAPYRMSGRRGKNDAADAAAICEAVTRPSMRFVPLKDEHQQATLSLHRTRQGFVAERTATYNRMRGLLAEFGVVLPQSPKRLRAEIGPHLDALPSWANRCISDLLEHTGKLEERIDEYDRALIEIAHTDERNKRLMQLRGVGPTTVSALLASLGAGHEFKHGRQVAAWLGLTPGQHSSGGKARLGSITKAGDAYLRGLLVIGARAVLASLGEKQDRFSRWARSLIERRGYWRAAVAIAAKNARMAWAILKYG
ncbi:IS110 family transposase [Burkholderia glumae]|uniref:IS110 family transposase n=1 Tax=Burkholderia glumae TaxID=337 RepID=UPI0001A4B79E|nr:IS110 family transposase [Burkholderia glumae]ACR32887.1 Transposase IS116/IS110/IS902 [Burkholderia glumae BGR1]UVS88574.1 IS110 family transposase [Burkholderia glumae]UVT00116.1 IS110 family transposase [Burkholderia glumae]